MRRVYALGLVFAIFISCICFPAFATEQDTESAVGVSLSFQKWDKPPVFSEMPSMSRGSGVFDLSDGNLTIYCTISGEGFNKTQLCKTNTTKIYVYIDLNRDASVKVELLNSSGTSLAEKTFTYHMTDEKTAVVKFTNLTSSQNYRVKITNNSQRQINVSGCVTD